MRARAHAPATCVHARTRTCHARASAHARITSRYAHVGLPMRRGACTTSPPHNAHVHLPPRRAHALSPLVTRPCLPIASLPRAVLTPARLPAPC
eukprot:364480-Chlamydomonas_euryale.AAC.26